MCELNLKENVQLNHYWGHKLILDKQQIGKSNCILEGRNRHPYRIELLVVHILETAIKVSTQYLLQLLEVLILCLIKTEV